MNAAPHRQCNISRNNFKRFARICACVLVPSVLLASCASHSDPRLLPAYSIEPSHDGVLNPSEDNYVDQHVDYPEMFDRELSMPERRQLMRANWAMQKAVDDGKLKVRLLAPPVQLTGDENIDRSATYEAVLVADDPEIKSNWNFLDVYEVRMSPKPELYTVQLSTSAQSLQEADKVLAEEQLARLRLDDASLKSGIAFVTNIVPVLSNRLASATSQATNDISLYNNQITGLTSNLFQWQQAYSSNSAVCALVASSDTNAFRTNQTYLGVMTNLLVLTNQIGSAQRQKDMATLQLGVVQTNLIELNRRMEAALDMGDVTAAYEAAINSLATFWSGWAGSRTYFSGYSTNINTLYITNFSAVSIKFRPQSVADLKQITIDVIRRDRPDDWYRDPGSGGPKWSQERLRETLDKLNRMGTQISGLLAASPQEIDRQSSWLQLRALNSQLYIECQRLQADQIVFDADTNAGAALSRQNRVRHALFNLSQYLRDNSEQYADAVQACKDITNAVYEVARDYGSAFRENLKNIGLPNIRTNPWVLDTNAKNILLSLSMSNAIWLNSQLSNSLSKLSDSRSLWQWFFGLKASDVSRNASLFANSITNAAFNVNATDAGLLGSNLDAVCSSILERNSFMNLSSSNALASLSESNAFLLNSNICKVLFSNSSISNILSLENSFNDALSGISSLTNELSSDSSDKNALRTLNCRIDCALSDLADDLETVYTNLNGFDLPDASGLRSSKGMQSPRPDVKTLGEVAGKEINLDLIKLRGDIARVNDLLDGKSAIQSSDESDAERHDPLTSSILAGKQAIYHLDVLHGIVATTAYMLPDDGAAEMFGHAFADHFYAAQVTFVNPNDKPILIYGNTMRLVVRMNAADTTGRLSEEGIPRRETWYATYEPLDYDSVRRMMEGQQAYSWQKNLERVLDAALMAGGGFVGVGAPSGFNHVFGVLSAMSPKARDLINQDLVRYATNFRDKGLDNIEEIPAQGTITKDVFLPKGPIYGIGGLDDALADDVPMPASQHRWIPFSRTANDYGKVALQPAYIFDVRREEVYVKGKRILASDSLSSSGASATGLTP